MIAHDISELLPPPAILTVESDSQTPVQVESGKELIDRVLHSTEWSSEDQPQEIVQPNRSENHLQKIINTNRDLAKENQTFKARVEKLLDEVHGYQIEGELVGSIHNMKTCLKSMVLSTYKWHMSIGSTYQVMNLCPHIYLKLAFPTVANRQQKTP